MKVIVNSLAINYTDEGKGPVVVLLHGWGITMGTFDDLAARLSKKYRVVRLDLPGFGGSERPQGVWGVQEYAVLVRNFLAKLKISAVQVIIGHSFGGRVAIKGLAREVLTAQKLVLLDSAGIKSTDSARNQLFKYAAKSGKLLFSLPFLSVLRGPARHRLYQAAGSTDYLEAGQMKDIFLKTIGEDLRSDASHVNLPVLMIWGEKDDVTPVEEAELMRAALPDARLELVAGAHHFVYLDEPEQVAQLLQEFIG